jgi:hypothetical protein
VYDPELRFLNRGGRNSCEKLIKGPVLKSQEEKVGKVKIIDLAKPGMLKYDSNNTSTLVPSALVQCLKEGTIKS